MAAAPTAEETSYGLSEPESFISFLEDAGIRLVRLEYLIDLRASGRPLPRRQEAEQETTTLGLPALVESDELRAIEIDPHTAHMSVMIRHPEPRRVKVHFVSISHMWESMQHPDPWRFQLDAIVEEFRPRLLDSVVWIFYDFVSLHQYTRNEDQERLFRRALRDIFVMYSHDAVEVHRIETLTPESVRERCVAAHGSKILVFWKEDQKMMDVPISKLRWNETPYDQRGWCRSEKEWSALRTWMKGENPVPLPPDMFWARMQQLKFTHREKVFKLQAKVFHQKAASTSKLLIENLDGDKIEVLAAALPFYTKLTELVATGTSENTWKAALAEITCENVRDEDAIALAADLSTEKCSHLERLHLKCKRLGEMGRNALQQMMEHRRSKLEIRCTADRSSGQSSGYLGHEIEPAMASESRATMRILVFKRRQPPQRRAVMVRPVEAIGDWSEDIREGQEAMAQEDFTMFLFELCTLWCGPNVSLSVYLLFLSSVFIAVTDARGAYTLGLRKLEDVQRLPQSFFELLSLQGWSSRPAEKSEDPLASWLRCNVAQEVQQATVDQVQKQVFQLTHDARSVFLFGNE
ncbi:unnamed protein product, partial [Symbiodinium sp. CCMP2456]